MTMFVFFSWAEVIRIIVGLGCMLLVGINFAFIIHAQRLFSTFTYRMWQWFFIGKTFMTAFVGVSIWLRVGAGEPLSWRTPVGLLGLLATNYSLWKLYKLRSHIHFGSSFEQKHPEEFV